jgi:hypothetical protein
MKSPTSRGDDRRKAERRAPGANERRSDVARAAVGDRRVVEKRGIGAAMVDALEDILRWERASERSLRAAAANSSSDLTNV